MGGNLIAGENTDETFYDGALHAVTADLTATEASDPPADLIAPVARDVLVHTYKGLRADWQTLLDMCEEQGLDRPKLPPILSEASRLGHTSERRSYMREYVAAQIPGDGEAAFEGRRALSGRLFDVYRQLYLIPPGKDMTMRDGCLWLTDRDSREKLSLPIDTFLRSLAEDGDLVP